MEMPKNAFKQALAEGRTQIGLWSSMPDAYVAEGLAGAGFDWLLFDTEHAPADPITVLPMLQAVNGLGVTPIVRPAWNDPVLIKRFLDIGAQTLLIPFVQSAEEARAAVTAMRFPPHGGRGVAGLTRATGYGRIKGYAQNAHNELCCLVQVETRTALDAIEDIAAVDGVDGIFVGPSDLAASLGHPGDNAHPEVLSAIDDAIARIQAAGKPAGILAIGEELARRSLAQGAKFVAVGSDMTVLMRGAEALAAKFKS